MEAGRLNRNDLISDEYRELNRQMHAASRGFGHSGRKHAADVLEFAKELSARSILDYGCGAGTLRAAVRVQGWAGDLTEYDPAIPTLDVMPTAADLVVCTDVLEHVEPEALDNVLDHLRSLTLMGAFLCVAVTESSKCLPDGRNAHLIVEQPNFWTRCLRRHRFRISRMQNRSDAEERIVDVTFWVTPA